MSQRQGVWLALLALLAAAAMRLLLLAALPPGMNSVELVEARTAEAARRGEVAVLYDTVAGGREGLYPLALAAVTSVISNGVLGFRMPSVWSGVLLVALVYRLGRRLYGPTTGVAAAWLLALWFWPVLLARTIGPQTVVPLLVATVLLVLTHALPQSGRVPTNTPYALLGLLLGLGFYVHPWHSGLVALVLLYGVMLWLSGQLRSRRVLGSLLFAALVGTIAALPYLLSSLSAPGLSAASRLLVHLDTITTQGQLRAVLAGLGAFVWRGDQSWLHNVPGRPLQDPLTFALVVIGVVRLARALPDRRALLLGATLLVLLPLALLAPDSPNFMTFASLLPVLALLFGVGAQSLIAWGRTVAHRRALGALVGMVLAGVGLWTSISLFGVWASAEPVRAAYSERTRQLAHHADLTAPTLPTVVCVASLARNTDLTTPTTPADALLTMMHRRDAALRFADCGTGLVLPQGGEPHQVLLLQADVLQRAHPVILAWLRQGEIADSAALPPSSVITMSVAAQLGDTAGRFQTTAFTGLAPESACGPTAALLPANLGNALAFLGYERERADAYEPSDIITSVTYWRVDAPLSRNLRFFTHMLFDAQSVVAQSDTISVRPDTLLPRDVIVQVTFVPTPSNIQPGTYDLSVGAYVRDAQRSARLPVLARGERCGTRLFVNQVTVQR